MARRAGLSLLSLIIFLIFLGHQAQAAWDPLDYVTYYGTTDQVITIAWDPPATGDPATSYDWRVFHVERQIYVIEDNTTDCQITIQFPRTGHYIIEVRARNAAGTSPWIESTDPESSSVDNQPRAWWIYGHVAGPGPVNIE